MKKKTMIIGVSTRTDRYANKAAHRLTFTGHPIINIGIHKGIVAGVPIETADVPHRDVHTITLYINPDKQVYYYDYILRTQPKRIIFNPGTENPILKEKAEQAGIETIEACTLVMLATNQF